MDSDEGARHSPSSTKHVASQPQPRHSNPTVLNAEGAHQDNRQKVAQDNILDAVQPRKSHPKDHETVRYTVARFTPRKPTSPIMIISKQNRRTIYENLFKEGVMVAKKDFNAPKHEELEVPNLEVIKAMQSLTSKGFVKTQFSWQYYYYTLTPEGLTYLREWLHLPAEIVPATHKKAARPPRPAGARPGAGGEGTYRAPRGGDRDGYRRRDGEGDAKESAPGEYRPRYAGVGRGAPRE